MERISIIHPQCVHNYCTAIDGVDGIFSVYEESISYNTQKIMDGESHFGLICAATVYRNNSELYGQLLLTTYAGDAQLFRHQLFLRPRTRSKSATAHLAQEIHRPETNVYTSGTMHIRVAHITCVIYVNV